MTIILFYFACVMLTAGMSYASFVRGFPALGRHDHTPDAQMALLLSVGGPLSLIAYLAVMMFGVCKFCGWKMPFSKYTAAEWDKYTPEKEKRECGFGRPKD